MSSLLTTIRRVLRLDAQQPEETMPSENILPAARAASAADEAMPPTPEASIISTPALTEAPLATAPPQESAGVRIEEVDISPVAATPAMVAESAESGDRVDGEPVAVAAAIVGVEPAAVDDPDVETDGGDVGAYAAQDAPAQFSDESVFMSQSAAPSLVAPSLSVDATIE